MFQRDHARFERCFLMRKCEFQYRYKYRVKFKFFENVNCLQPTPQPQRLNDKRIQPLVSYKMKIFDFRSIRKKQMRNRNKQKQQIKFQWIDDVYYFRIDDKCDQRKNYRRNNQRIHVANKHQSYRHSECHPHNKFLQQTRRFILR